MNVTNCEKMFDYLKGTNDCEKNYELAIKYFYDALEKGDIKCKEKYYDFIVHNKILGRSFKERIFIVEENSRKGIGKEYELLEKILGERDEDYFLEKQIAKQEENRWLDLMFIKLPSGEEITYYFDISHFFGE